MRRYRRPTPPIEVRVKLDNITHAAQANASGTVGTACGRLCNITEIVSTSLLFVVRSEVDCMACIAALVEP